MPRRHRRNTIGQNPLDQLAIHKGKKKKKSIPTAPEVQSQVRELLNKKSSSKKKSPLKQWVKSVLHRFTS